MNSKIANHFKKADPLLYKTFIQMGSVDSLNIQVPKDHFTALCREIIAQQLSSKVARVIFTRFLNIFPKQKVTAKSVLNLSQEKLRAVGMSNSKAKFLLDLADKVNNKELNLKDLSDLDNEAIITELTKVKGVGKWTAEMFLMFALGREDVFSHGDLGLKRAIQKIYNLEKPTQSEIEKIVIKWSPYKTYACRILWRSLGG